MDRGGHPHPGPRPQPQCLLQQSPMLGDRRRASLVPPRPADRRPGARTCPGDACRAGFQPERRGSRPGRQVRRAGPRPPCPRPRTPRPGQGPRHIARHLGWGRHTVQQDARATRRQDMVKGRTRRPAGGLDPFKPCPTQESWAETGGKATILDLHREITARGLRGHYRTVRDWIRRDLPQPPARRLRARPATTVGTAGDRPAHPASGHPHGDGPSTLRCASGGRLGRSHGGQVISGRRRGLWRGMPWRRRTSGPLTAPRPLRG